MNVDDDEVPKSASDTTIAFYLRSDMEAGHIITSRVYSAISAMLENAPELPLLSQLQVHPEIADLVRSGLRESALMKENWYRDL